MTIHDWLSPLNYALQENDCINLRQEGTGLWLLASRENQDWLNTTIDTLFCPDNPGSGKMILTLIVVDDLSSKFQESSTGIAYIYCNSKGQDEQTAADLLASLLKKPNHISRKSVSPAFRLQLSKLDAG
jgi:hypothetical protein